MALMVGLLAAGTVGCGGDDDDDDEPVAGSSGAGAGGSSGGGSGSGGSKAGMGGGGGAGMGGGGGAGMGGMGGGAPMTKMCGTATCTAIMTAAGTTLPPCCDAMEGNACGVQTNAMDPMECIAIKQMGVADTSCPTAQSVLGMTVPGCCKPNGKCGLMSGTLMGCVENSRYPTAFVMGGMRPAAATCMGGGDAGTP